jgi:ubiquinone biosynthesis protein
MAVFVRRAARKRLSPRRRLHQVGRMMIEAEYLMQILPDQMVGLLEQTRRGELQIQLDHRKIGSTVNRLVVGLIASALFLGSALLLAMEVPPVMFAEPTYFGIQKISVLGTMGTLFSVMMMLRLYLAINASGHLSRDNED